MIYQTLWLYLNRGLPIELTLVTGAYMVLVPSLSRGVGLRTHFDKRMHYQPPFWLVTVRHRPIMFDGHLVMILEVGPGRPNMFSLSTITVALA